MSTPIARWIGGERVEVPPRPEAASRRALLPMLAPILRSLSKGDGGRARATYAVLRAMLWQDFRYACGDESIRVAVNTAARRGILHRRQVLANPSDRTGRIEIWYPDEAELRAARWREKVAKRQERQRARQRSNERNAAPVVFQSADSDRPAEREAAADHQNAHAHIRTALAAIQAVKPASLTRPKQPDEIAVRAHPRTLAEQLAELERLGFDVPKVHTDPPDK